MSRRRVVMIGLDAADKDLLLAGCDDGRLPVLRRLRDTGAFGVVDAPPGFGSGAVWPSIYTGVSPARHGRYFYRQVHPGEYEATRFQDSDFHARAFWEALGEAGRRVAVFDVPKAALSPGLNGVHVVDWLVHGPVYHEVRTSPASVAQELVGKYGADPLPQCDQPGMRSPEEHRALRDIFVARVRRKLAATLDWLDREDWDFFLTVFGDPHCVGHQCWHVRDRSHPLHDAAAAAAVGDPVLDVYVEIDAAIGRIAEHVGDDVLLIVLSATGMGANYTGNYVLDEVLRRLEGAHRTTRLATLQRLKERAKRVLPRAVRRRFRQTSRRIEERALHGDRQRRRLFTVPHNDIAGAVRVNLVGREPGGLVRPDELDALFTRLRRDLLELRNLEHGGPVVEDVVRVAEYCSGAHLDEMPDFFVIWRRDAPIERVGSPKVGEVVHRRRGNRTGDHRAESVFFATGPGVVRGQVEGVSIMDFAPTIAAQLGVRLDGSDGHEVEALGGRTEGSARPEHR